MSSHAGAITITSEPEPLYEGAGVIEITRQGEVHRWECRVELDHPNAPALGSYVRVSLDGGDSGRARVIVVERPEQGFPVVVLAGSGKPPAV